MKYIILMIMLLAASYVSGQGTTLYNGIVSGSPDTTFHARNKVYNIGGSNFLLGTYDRDEGAIYGVHLRSTEHFSEDDIEKRDSLVLKIKSEYDLIYGPPALDRGGYLPFMGSNQYFTIYAWKDEKIILMLNIYGRSDNTNIIKIEIYDPKML